MAAAPGPLINLPASPWEGGMNARETSAQQLSPSPPCRLILIKLISMASLSISTFNDRSLRRPAMAEPKDDTSGSTLQHQAFFYGPASIPSSSTPTSSRSKDLSAYTILCVAFKMTTIILIIIVIAVVTLWLIFQPQSLKACAVAASLTTFNLSGPGDGVLGYNLTVKLTFRNPNTKYNIYYDRMHAQAIYNGQLLGSARFPRMHQLRKSTMPVAMRFLGQGNVTGGDSIKRNFGRQKAEGFFYVGVKVYTTVRLKMALIKSVKFKPDVDCLLRLPVPTNATSLAAGFTTTDCDVHNFS